MTDESIDSATEAPAIEPLMSLSSERYVTSAETIIFSVMSFEA